VKLRTRHVAHRSRIAILSQNGIGFVARQKCTRDSDASHQPELGNLPAWIMSAGNGALTKGKLRPAGAAGLMRT